MLFSSIIRVEGLNSSEDFELLLSCAATLTALASMCLLCFKFLYLQGLMGASPDQTFAQWTTKVKMISCP